MISDCDFFYAYSSNGSSTSQPVRSCASRFAAVFAFASEGGIAYAVTELLEGKTLGEKLTREGAGAWRTVLDIGLAVADGLGVAHSRGITHRDIKPLIPIFSERTTPVIQRRNRHNSVNQ